jgi:hypothetical protein
MQALRSDVGHSVNSASFRSSARDDCVRRAVQTRHTSWQLRARPVPSSPAQGGAGLATAKLLPGAHIVRAFNAINYTKLSAYR